MDSLYYVVQHHYPGVFFFFLNDRAPPEFYPLPLPDALPISIALVRSPASVGRLLRRPRELVGVNATTALAWIAFFYALRTTEPLLVQVLFSGIGPLTIVCLDRKSTRLNSSHGYISYAVFCLK